MSMLPVYNQEGKVIDKITVDEALFDGKVNEALLHQAIVMYQANTRRGSASTKKRSEVRGGGRKPWRQKGTGRARAGSIRSPLWKGGGVAHGPHPRDFSYSIPKKMKRLALKSSLNARFKDGKISVVDNIVLDTPKTKQFLSVLSSLEAGDRSLVILEHPNSNIMRASRNILHVTVRSADDFNAYDVLTHERVILSRKALETVARYYKETEER